MNSSEMNRKFMELKTEHFWGSPSKLSFSTHQKEYKFGAKRVISDRIKIGCCFCSTCCLYRD